MKKYPHYTIGELCDIVKGETGIASAIPSDYPLVTTGIERKSCNTYQFDTEAVCIPLVSSTGHGNKSLNYIHYQSGKFALGTILAAVIPKNKSVLSAEYLQRYLFFYKDRLVVPLMKGAANVSLAVKDIAKIKVPVPPISKQKDFIELFKKVESAKHNLLFEYHTQSTLLAKLRQAILQEAIEGKLTAEWRKENPVRKGDPDYDAEALLEKIKTEKEKLIKEGKIKKQKALPPIKPEEMQFELPDGWLWTRLGEIANHNSGKTLDSVRNKGVLTKYITTSNLYWGYFVLDNLREMPIDNKELDRVTAIKGDLLVCEGGEAGRSAVWENDSPICFQNHIHRVRLYCNIKPYYVFRIFQFLNYSGKINEYRKGMGITNLSAKSLSLISFSLPPLAEQQVIVERVDKLLAIVDELEKQVADRKEKAEQLMQAVLREAFEGEY